MGINGVEIKLAKMRNAELTARSYGLMLGGGGLGC